MYVYCTKKIKKPIQNIGERLNDIFEKRQSILRQSTGMIATRPDINEQGRLFH